MHADDFWRQFAESYRKAGAKDQWEDWIKMSPESRKGFAAAWSSTYPDSPIPPREPQGASRPCGNCGGSRFTAFDEKKNEGFGCVLLVLGLILAPVLIGIPIVVAALFMMNSTEEWWVCDSCGAKLPA